MNFKNTFTKIYNHKFILALISLSFFFLISDYSDLGYFADDIGTIFFLSQDISFNRLIEYSFNWDAARDLHLIWQKILIEISEPEIRERIHLYQFLLYFLNSLLVFYILIILKIDKYISSVALALFIFTSTYSEVSLWTHAFSMVLFSITFFLLFLIINLKLIKIKHTKKILIYEILSIIFLLLNLFTYEQSIATCFSIILLRQIIKIKFYKIKIKDVLPTFSVYFFIILFFSLYKSVEAGFFNSNSNLYYTGTNIVKFNQIFLNIVHGYAVIIKDYLSFDFNFYSENFNNKKYFYF